MPLRGSGLRRLRDRPTALAIAPAAPGCGVPPPRDGQEGRFRTASLHPPAAPNDHHHHYLANVLPGYGVATKSRPCALVAFVAIQATQPLRPAGRLICRRRASGDLGVGDYSAAAGCRMDVRGVA